MSLLLVMVGAVVGSGHRSTPYWGFDANNSKWNRNEGIITQAVVDKLELKCTVETGADTSGVISISDEGIAYFPTWAGDIFAVDIETCQVRWNVTVSGQTGQDNDAARVTPMIYEDMIVLGNGQGSLGGGASVFAMNRHNASPLWQTMVDPHPAAIITTSLVYDRFGYFYGGVASREEALAAVQPGYECCDFKGSIYSLYNNGTLRWQTSTIPEDLSGNAVWGSSFSINEDARVIYVASGNNYIEDPEITACVEALPEGHSVEDVEACLGEDNHINAVMAVHMDTGVILWSRTMMGPDAWTVACINPSVNPENCPENAGPDFDFGQSPMRFEVNGKAAVGAGQKSGIFWTHDAFTGELLWATGVGPGSSLGGMQWGSSTDQEGIYVSNANRDYADYTLPNGTVACGGAWAKLDVNTGDILWVTPDPFSVLGEEECEELREDVFPAPELKRNAPGHAEGPLAYPQGTTVLVNDLMFAGSMTGFVYAFDTSNGDIVWSYDTGGSINGAPSFWNGHAIVPSGYARFDLGPGNDRVFIFQIPPAPGPAQDTNIILIVAAVAASVLLFVVVIYLIAQGRRSRRSGKL